MPLPTKRNQDFLEKGLILWLGKRKSETCPEHNFVPEGKKRAQGIRTNNVVREDGIARNVVFAAILF